tara:strand:- start:2 stop:502 length:501 start_codon:yes stop_codon:yes gene_type:complete
MFQEKLNELRPYVTGIRFVKDLPVVDVVLREGWDMFESDNVMYKVSTNNQNYFMVHPKDPKNSLDIVLDHVEHIIDFNIEKENKLTLLKAKIEELKVLFTDKPLKELEKLKFVFQTITEPTLEDIARSPSTKEVKINGIELPPKPPKDREVHMNGESRNKLEKEEN